MSAVASSNSIYNELLLADTPSTTKPKTDVPQEVLDSNY